MLNAPTKRIIAEIDKEDFKPTDLGILIPTAQKSREFMKTGNKRTIDHTFTNHIREGVVTSVGEGSKEVVVGNRIVFNRHDGEEFDFNDKRYISLPWNAVMLVLN